MIALQRKIDGQSLSNAEELPWYGVGPSDPTPVPILGPDIIDPRQMDMIRRLAESGARREDGVVDTTRALPVRTTAVAAVGGGAKEAAAVAEAVSIAGGNSPWEESDDIREQRRKAALARKSARASQRGQEGDA
jgi:hypothetical protein